MFINEYGDKNNPLVLSLAPMMVSGADLYQLMHPYFKHDYHYIAPDQGGHGEAGANIGADEEYKTLKSLRCTFILPSAAERCICPVACSCGFIRLLPRRQDRRS